MSRSESKSTSRVTAVEVLPEGVGPMITEETTLERTVEAAAPETEPITRTSTTKTSTRGTTTTTTEPAGMPARSRSQLSKQEELISSIVKNAKSREIEVVFAFDTTGSMMSYLTELKKTLRETITKLMKDIPTIKIGIMAVGDYCDYNNYVVRSFDLTSNVNQIVSFVDSVPPTDGDDFPEAYECALREAKSLSWTKGDSKNKALVMIGDAVPHAPSFTDQNIWWRAEVNELVKAGIKIYGVQAGKQPYADSFYKEMAEASGGVYLDLTKVSLITEMFMAVCYREFSPEALNAYNNEREKTAEPALKRMLSQLKEGEEAKQSTCEPKEKSDATDQAWYRLENAKEELSFTFAAGTWKPLGARLVHSLFPAIPYATLKKSKKSIIKKKLTPTKAALKVSPTKKIKKNPKKRIPKKKADVPSIKRATSHLVGSGNWKRDRTGRMSSFF